MLAVAVGAGIAYSMTGASAARNTARQMRCRLNNLDALRVRKLWTTSPIVPVNIGVRASGTEIMYSSSADRFWSIACHTASNTFSAVATVHKTKTAQMLRTQRKASQHVSSDEHDLDAGGLED
jgi:hypothetical protein